MFTVIICEIRIMKEDFSICNNEQFKESLMNAESLLIVSLDNNGNVSFINRSGANFLGYEIEDILGKNWFENFLPLEIRKRVYNVFKNILKGNIRRFKVYQNDVLCKNGLKKRVHFTNSLIRKKRKIIGTLSVGIDITDYTNKTREIERLKSIDEILIDTSARLGSAADITKIVGIVLEAAKRLTDSKYGYVGYIDDKRGDLYIPRFSKDIMGECEVRNKDAAFKNRRGLWGRSISDVVDEGTGSAGTPKKHLPIDRFLVVPLMEDGRIVGQIAVANSKRDYNDGDIDALNRLSNMYSLVTGRFKAINKLRETLRKLYISLEIASQIVCIYNLDTGKLEFEGDSERIIGYRIDELPDNIEGFFEFMHPDDRERIRSLSLKSQGYIDIQVRFRKKDGKYIYMH